VFFFEKKNQKTFTNCGQPRASRLSSVLDATDKSLLLLFFRKEDSSFFAAYAANVAKNQGSAQP
jgi:hypothetical protein